MPCKDNKFWGVTGSAEKGSRAPAGRFPSHPQLRFPLPSNLPGFTSWNGASHFSSPLICSQEAAKRDPFFSPPFHPSSLPPSSPVVLGRAPLLPRGSWQTRRASVRLALRWGQDVSGRAAEKQRRGKPSLGWAQRTESMSVIRNGIDHLASCKPNYAPPYPSSDRSLTYIAMRLTANGFWASGGSLRDFNAVLDRPLLSDGEKKRGLNFELG